MICSFTALSGRHVLWAASLAGSLSFTLSAAEPVGFNFVGTRAGDGSVAAEETAFGVPGSQWANIPFTSEGNPNASTNTGNTPVEIGGVTYTLEWTTGSLWSGQINPATTPEEKVLAYYAINSWAAGVPPARIAISGLAAAHPNGYSVKVISASRDGAAFHPVDVTAGGTTLSLGFTNITDITPHPGYPNAGFAISASPTLTADSVEVVAGPEGGGLVSGLAAIIIEEPGLPIPLNAFNAGAEIPQWNEGDPIPDNAWESRPTDNASAIDARAASLSLDPGKDAANDPADPAQVNPASGALKVSANFGAAGTFHEWRVLRHFPGGAAFDLTSYEKLSYSVYYDPSSTKRGAGFGFYDIWLLLAPETEGGADEWLKLTANTVDGIDTGGEMPGSAATKWVRVDSVLPVENPRLRAVRGVAVSGVHRAGGTATLWIDDFQLVTPAVVVEESEPPALGIEPAEPGLLLVGSGDWNRQNIRTVGNGYAWRGVATEENPVSYSITMPELPGAVDMQTHIFLVPDLGEDPLPSINNQPDWSRSVVARLVIYNNAAGGASARVDYKTSGPESNGNPVAYWDADDGLNGGALANLSAASYAGTWTWTWTSDTDFTLTAPSYWVEGELVEGESITGALTPEASELFSGGLFVYFGMMPNGASRVGHPLWLSEISITGVGAPAAVDFMQPIDPAVWSLLGAYPQGIIPVTASEAPLWLSWNENLGRGYVLKQSTALRDWEDATPAASLLSNGERRVLSNGSGRPAGPQVFFRLEK